MSVKRRRFKKKLFTKLLSIVVIVIAIVVIVRVGLDTYSTLSLRKDVEKIEEELERLKGENEVLTSTKSKLEDPEYVTTYARGEYMFSKDNEKVFYLPSKSE